MSACLSDDEVLAFLDLGPSGRSRTDADGHLKQCGDCRSLVAEAARGLYEPDGDAATLVESRSAGAGAWPLARPLEPGELVSRYRIVRPVGAGGAGLVYEAFDPQLGRRIALKMVRPDATDEITTGPTRLLREAQAMARLSHPNVVSVHDAGTFQGQVFAAMEYVDGRTLASWLSETRPSWRAIVRVFIDAGRGLAAAHSAHLIHRDFKPENVLLGKDGRARVTDFGLARTNNFSDPEPARRTDGGGAAPRVQSLLTLTEAGALAGTPAYMAPEQFQGARADERTDQFNFCAALYKALYRQRPFGDERGDTITIATLSREVIAGRLRVPPPDTGVPESAFAIVRRGLERDPTSRFPTMTELLEALSLVLEEQPETPARSGARRRGARAIAAAAGVGALVALAAITRLVHPQGGHQPVAQIATATPHPWAAPAVAAAAPEDAPPHPSPRPRATIPRKDVGVRARAATR